MCDATPRGVDPDADGVPAVDDNCSTVTNAGQADADGDGAGDACEATPNPGPAVPVSTPPVTEPVITPPVAVLDAPALGALKLSAGTLTRTQPLTVRFSLDRAAVTKLMLYRKPVGGTARSRPCRWRACAAPTGTGCAGPSPALGCAAGITACVCAPTTARCGHGR